MDERIHFALVCGAKSCPPIRIYTPESLEEGLQGAAEAFCASEVSLDPANGSVSLSKIFQVGAPARWSLAHLSVGFICDSLPVLRDCSRGVVYYKLPFPGLKRPCDSHAVRPVQTLVASVTMQLACPCRL
jgi:hypothetical protein